MNSYEIVYAVTMWNQLKEDNINLKAFILSYDNINFVMINMRAFAEYLQQTCCLEPFLEMWLYKG